MEIDLNRLNSEQQIFIDEDFSIDLNTYKSNDIVNLTDLHVRGNISYNAADNLELNMFLTGNMILKDSVTLEDILYPLNVDIEEEYSLEEEYFKEYYEKEQNILDIIAILWENIVLEVPISLTKTKDAKLSGEGWTFGEDKNINDNIDPRLQELTKILDEGKE